MTEEQSHISSFGAGEETVAGTDDDLAEARHVAEGDEAAEFVDTSEHRFPDADGTVEIFVTQVDYTVEGYGDAEYPVLHVFGRTGDRTVEHVRVFDFEPYFYTPVSDLSHEDPGDTPLRESHFDDDRLLEERLLGLESRGDRDPTLGDPEADEVVTYRSIRGEELVKVLGQTPRDVGQLRDRFDHFEADILFPNRLLIDKDVTSGVSVPCQRADDGTLKVHHEQLTPVEMQVDQRVHVLDIEVDDRAGFPEDGEEPIICMTSHDSYRDEYVAWLYEAPDATVDAPTALDDYEFWDEAGEGTVDLRVFDTEEAMHEAYLDYLEETDVDVLTGWNFDDFDAPYLVDRLEELGLDSERLSRIDEVWDSGWGGPDIKGRVVFDLLYGYERTQFSELDSYRLDAVAEVELGVGKERYAGDIGDLWEQDPERLLEYNLRDVELCVEIDRKQAIVAFWEEVASFVGCKLEDATTPGDAVDLYILHKVHGEFALPSKGTVESEEYEGGAVFDPISGVRENVTVLDLASLYPMAMVTTNASPETKVDPADYDGDTYRAPNGTHFRKEPDGIIREMVDELLSERDQKKTARDENEPGSEGYERFDRQQQAVKVIMNCFTPDTEVLTPDGVRNIRELDVGDEVYSLDPETMRLEVKPVTETHSYPDYQGDLVDIETSKIDFRVTPNHRMLVRKDDTNGITEDEWGFVEAGDLYDYCHYEMPHDWSFEHGGGIDEVDLVELAEDNLTFDLAVSDDGECVAADGGAPGTQRYVEGDDFVRLLGWFATEGWTHCSEDRSTQYTQLAQENADGRAKLDSLLDDAMRTYSKSDRDFRIAGRVWRELFETLCGRGSENKRLPDKIVQELSERQKWLLLETLIEGDGDWNPGQGSFRYSTNSEQLRDDVLKLCLQLGLTPKYRLGDKTWRLQIDLESKNSFRMHRDGSRSTAEDGVYCVTVADNHTLVAGRNGKFQNISQSLYGVLGWDRFRLYDKEMGAAVTATGREVIEHTESAANEAGYEVAYGDTDSVMLQISDVSPDDVEGDIEVTDAMREAHPEMDETELEALAATIEKGFELEEHINDSYDEFALETLNATHHRFRIEFEKLYRRFFQAGKKKRYAGHIVWKEGKDVDDVDITGFEYKRSDIAPVTKEVQKTVLEMIVKEGDVAGVKEYVHDVVEEFRTGERPLDDIGIPGGIGKRLDNYDTDTAHVRGAKYANLLLGTNFQRGSKPKRLYLKKVHPDFWDRIEAERGLDAQQDPLYGEFKRNPDVICFEFADEVPDEFEIDWDKMLDKTLKGPIARVLEALDVSWDEVKTGQDQTGLGQYM